MLNGGRLEVHDAVSAQLARTLLDATVAHPRPASGPSHRDVTVVIPVRDNIPGLLRLVGTLRGMRVVVVDDGSATPVQQSDFADMHCDIQVLRHARSKGPAAARNTGLAACNTDFVAFLDSDVVPRRGWLEALLGHFCDPAVALVAPRIVGLRPAGQPGGPLRGGALLARPRPARGAGGAVRDCFLRAQCRDHLPSLRAQGIGRLRRDAQVRRGRRPVLAASSRPARGCATNPSRWSLTTTARRLRDWFCAQVFLRRSRGTACPFGIPARPRRW